MATSQHEITEPSITVCVISRDREAWLQDTLRSVSRVLSHHRWSLVVFVYGNHDDAGGLAKREITSAYRVAVYQLPDSNSRREQIERCFRMAHFLRHECEQMTILYAGEIMLDAFPAMMRAARQHNHRIMLGVTTYEDDTEIQSPNRWPFTHRGPAMALSGFVADADLLGVYPTRTVDADTDFWLAIADAGVAPGGFTRGIVSHVERRFQGPQDANQADDAWVQYRVERLGLEPACLVIMASGERALMEAEIAARSCRNACDDTIPIIVATDDQARVEAWDMDDLEAWPIAAFTRQSDVAMEFYRGPEHLRTLFRSVLCRPAIVREAMSERGSCVMVDSDILFLRPFGPLPPVPAAAPKSFPWQMSGSYQELHQWGLISAGVMSFPAGSHGFVEAWEAHTIQNASLYRDGRCRTSAPGGSAFCEQDAWDMAGMICPRDSLTPGHNVTPSALGDYCPVITELAGSGPHMMDVLARTLGIEVHEGLWRNGWPVRSLHCHWGGNQLWNGAFEEIMIECLEASGCGELVKLLAASGRSPAEPH